ncbi:MAG: hypothetical protein RL329_2234 [Bacteroidota bacterium]|jgi:hypothetical protein
MKKLLSLVFAFGLTWSVVKAQNAPVMTLEKNEVDYGTITAGSEPFRFFKFKNTGKAPLVIQNAQASCGCTVPEYPKQPIMPNESAEIKVRYDTNRVGGFTKQITLTTNESTPTRVLTIKGTVLDKNTATAPAAAPTGHEGHGHN